MPSNVSGVADKASGAVCSICAMTVSNAQVDSDADCVLLMNDF